MFIEKNFKQELFEDSSDVENIDLTKTKTRTILPPLTLEQIKVVTAHYYLYSRLKKLSIERNIDYLIFKRLRSSHCSPRNKFYYSIVAVPAGEPRARQVRSQTNIIAIVDLPYQAKFRRNSNQYKHLERFCEEIATYDLKQPYNQNP